MASLNLSRCALTSCVAVAMLAGCGGWQPPIGAPATSSAQLAGPSRAYTSVYSFQGQPDGKSPEARLSPFNGALYGTTSAGGKKCAGNGCGTIFKLTLTGHETVLYRFTGMPDGQTPLAELTAVNQDLYGTTYVGGSECIMHGKRNAGCGTVFSIAPSGAERVLYRFGALPDGARPQGPLTWVNGKLYGTTTLGGTNCNGRARDGCGTVYSIDRSGKESVLHRFAGELDGEQPTGNLVFVNGALYGTTLEGGAYGGGCIFEITPEGYERVIYSPKDPTDIIGLSYLLANGNMLYGVSEYGGTHNGGTVYSVTTGGTVQILHNFIPHKPLNGVHPIGRLVGVNGSFYGTTLEGGVGGYGLVYALNIASGKFRVVYPGFKGSPDGAVPYAGLTDAKGTLYGTTYLGGTGCHYQYCQPGYGTVFSLQP